MQKEKIKTALIVVDLQREFIDGKLMIPYSSNIVNKVNKIQNKFDIVCFVKNVFPEKEKVLDKVTISDSGNYCIEKTNGVDFHQDLKINDNVFIRNYDENFSVMNSKMGDISLLDFLDKNGITHVFLSGVPGDYSVKYSAMQLIGRFKTYVLVDMIKTIGKMDNFIRYLVIRKIPFINSDDLNIVLRGLLYDKYEKQEKMSWSTTGKEIRFKSPSKWEIKF